MAAASTYIFMSGAVKALLEQASGQVNEKEKNEHKKLNY
jgi:hypothetical protein